MVFEGPPPAGRSRAPTRRGAACMAPPTQPLRCPLRLTHPPCRAAWSLLILLAGIPAGCARRESLLQPELPRAAVAVVAADAVPPPEDTDPGPEAVPVVAVSQTAPAE